MTTYLSTPRSLLCLALAAVGMAVAVVCELAFAVRQRVKEDWR